VKLQKPHSEESLCHTLPLVDNIPDVKVELRGGFTVK
jgi:hypothetical protein